MLQSHRSTTNILQSEKESGYMYRSSIPFPHEELYSHMYLQLFVAFASSCKLTLTGLTCKHLYRCFISNVANCEIHELQIETPILHQFWMTAFMGSLTKEGRKQTLPFMPSIKSIGSDSASDKSRSSPPPAPLYIASKSSIGMSASTFKAANSMSSASCRQHDLLFTYETDIPV